MDNNWILIYFYPSLLFSVDDFFNFYKSTIFMFILYDSGTTTVCGESHKLKRKSTVSAHLLPLIV